MARNTSGSVPSSGSSIGVHMNRHVRNSMCIFHAKITPLIAIFALVAFSIFAFIKLPAFAQNSVQDLNKTDAFSAGSGQDLNKTEVLCGGSAGSGQGAQNGSVQTPSNEQVQDLNKTDVSREHSADPAEQEQDLSKNRVSRKHSADPAEHEQDNSVITPLDTQTEQNQQVQDNCVQTHSAGQDSKSNSPITHLNTQISAQVPLRVQSTTIAPKASPDTNIVLSDDAEATASGTGWTYDSATSVYTILNGANVTISGTTTNKRIVVASGNATVTLNGASIDQSSSNNASGSPFSLSSGASVILKLYGSNTLKSGINEDSNYAGYAGLNVPSGATVTIESISEGASLTAAGRKNATGIGGESGQSAGSITINSGIIVATGGPFAAGIGGGEHGSGGTITINGGIVTAYAGQSAAGIGGGTSGSGGTITINGGIVTANGSDDAGIGGGQYGTGGNITITGGTVIAKARNGNDVGSIGNGWNSSSGGSTTISGSTVIGIGGQIGMGNTDTTAITNHPIILAPSGIKGQAASSDNRANGILVGSDVSIDTSTTPITVTINADMTIPSGADFQVPAGVKVVVPSEVTLTVVEGGTLDISGELDVEESGTVTIEDGSNYVIEDGGQISGGGIVNKPNGSDVSAPTLISKTSTSITINPVTLLSTTGQEVEYAISTTNELPASEEDWQAETSEGTITIEEGEVSFTGLTANTQYYIFARAKENTTHKAGTEKQLPVKTIPTQVAYTNETDDEHGATTWWTFSDGTLTINLENVYTATGSTSVEVVGSACGNHDSICRLSIQHVVFTNADDHVTELTIGDEAFEQVPTLETSAILQSISFPSNLTTLSIGQYAFSQQHYGNASSLTSVIFPEGLVALTISANAFYQSTNSGNTSLTSVTFPNSLQTLNIGEGAFAQGVPNGNTSLASVTFPSTLTALNIGTAAFKQGADSGNTTLSSVSFPASLTSLTIGQEAFAQNAGNGSTSLTSVTFPSTLTTLNIGTAAFVQVAENGSTSLTSVTFPNSLQTLNIGQEAFSQYCDNGANTTLQSVTFPATLTTLTIDYHAFVQTSQNGATTAFKYAFLPSSHLPANTTVASGAFQSGKSIYWLGATGTAFGVLPTGNEGSSPTLTQLPLTSLTATAPSEEELNIATGSPVSFEGVQAVYGGEDDQPRFPAVSGTVPLSPTTSDELDFTKYKIISTVSGGPDENATVNDNSITFTSTGERTVTLSVPGFTGSTKEYIVNVTGQILASVDFAGESLVSSGDPTSDQELIQETGTYLINSESCVLSDGQEYITGSVLKTSGSLTPFIEGSERTVHLIRCSGEGVVQATADITLPARPSTPAQGENTFQVTGEHVYTDEYETLAIQPGYEYYKLSDAVDSSDTCSNTTSGYTQVSDTATTLTGPSTETDGVGTYCVRKSAVNTGEEAFHSSAAKASVHVGTEVRPDPTPIDPTPPETPEELIINPSEIQGAWVDANGVVHANQNGTITIILHEKLHDGKTVEAKLEDYDLSSSVDTDIIDNNTVTFPHASPHIITASLKSNSALTTQVLVEVEPVSTPVDPTTPNTPDNPNNPANPSASNTSTIGSVAQTGVPANVLGLVMLMMLLLGVGLGVRKRTV